MKHTPGPWKVEPLDRYHNYHIKPKDSCEAVYPTDDVLATARLISQAPEMLELLEQAHHFMISSYPEWAELPLVTQIREVMAKAKGKS